MGKIINFIIYYKLTRLNKSWRYFNVNNDNLQNCCRLRIKLPLRTARVIGRGDQYRKQDQNFIDHLPCISILSVSHVPS